MRIAFDFDNFAEEAINNLRNYYKTDTAGVLRKAIALLELGRENEIIGNHLAIVEKNHKYKLIDTGYMPRLQRAN